MIEFCIQNISDVLLLNEYSDLVSRIEVNSSLALGGLTPSLEFIKKCRSICNFKIISMLRLREGSFIYSDLEFEIMFNDLKNMINYVDGIAFGSLNEDGSINISQVKKVLEFCYENNKEFVFHRAIDVSKDYISSINQLIDLKVTRILTSGHEDNIDLGFKNILKIKRKDKLLLGCGINENNFSKYIKNYQIHGSFSKKSENGYICLDKVKLDKIKDILVL